MLKNFMYLLCLLVMTINCISYGETLNGNFVKVEEATTGNYNINNDLILLENNIERYELQLINMYDYGVSVDGSSFKYNYIELDVNAKKYQFAMDGNEKLGLSDIKKFQTGDYINNNGILLVTNDYNVNDKYLWDAAEIIEDSNDLIVLTIESESWGKMIITYKKVSTLKTFSNQGFFY